ncbi:MAG TPA: ComF family protein [Patescibacteria group bacterium]|nr:ComF family protein [Patescibacteria group bacterium]
MDKLKKRLVELLYPKRIKCCVCGREAKESVCSSCLSHLEYLEGRVCLKCGKGIDDEYNNNICPDCQREDKHFDMAFSCFQYKDMGKTIIHKLKYESCKEVACVLARFMHQKLIDEGLEMDAVVSVPIHKSKEEVRGFNQAQLIAEEIAAAMDRPLWNCITRTKVTTDQFKLDKIHRNLNVHNAFCINMLYNEVKYKNVLLVDDVYTTGSTVDECSRILKQQGVQRVFVITAATGSNT